MKPSRGGTSRGPRRAAVERGALAPGRLAGATSNKDRGTAKTRESSAPRATGPPPARARVLAGIDLFEGRIEKLIAGGDGLARVEGIPIFLPRTAPGDLVRARLVQRRPDYGRAEVVEWLERGPDRREPPCPYFSRCGGCDLQHLEESAQVASKVRAALETLERLAAGLALPAPKVLGAAPWRYRLRAELHTEASPDGSVQVGYFERGSKRLVPVESCAVLVPELEAALRELVRMGREKRKLPPRIDLASGSDGAVTLDPPVPGFRSDAVARGAAGFEFEFDARCFFQAHAGLLEELVRAVVGRWRGEIAVDLYSGVGLFTLPLARNYRRTVAVEGNAVAARYARRNARKSGLSGIEIVRRAVESWSLESLDRVPDRVVLDPPRAGLPLGLIAALRKLRPPRVTYVSCHAAALARDLGRLAGAYRVEAVSFLDLFPQTGHLETIVQLVSEPARAAR